MKHESILISLHPGPMNRQFTIYSTIWTLESKVILRKGHVVPINRKLMASFLSDLHSVLVYNIIISSFSIAAIKSILQIA